MKRAQIYKEPYLVKRAIHFLAAYLSKKHQVFEWGSGSSTLWMAERVKRVVTVEHNKDWSHAVLLASKKKKLNVVVHFVEPYDVDEYALRILRHGGIWDFILIDGPEDSRFRCAKLAIERIKPGGVIMLDNSNTIPSQPVVKLLNAQGWWGLRMKGDFFLEDTNVGEGETSLWARPKK